MSVAFFDIDGTLVAKPSLERRLFWELQRRGKIPARNYLRWLAQILRQASSLRGLRDFRAAVQTNKSYLRGVAVEIPFASSAQPGKAKSCSATSRSAERGDPDSSGAICYSASPGSSLPEFFPAAIQRVWWHALRGDAIVLVSGTLAALVEIVQFALQRELLWRGVECKIFSFATQLEIVDGRWTDGVADRAIFGEEKALAVKEFARAQNISLARCSAYGDSSLDRWMLAAVGHPFAVNPTRRLRRIARASGWQILYWTHCAVRSASEQRSAAERTASEQHGSKKSWKLKREAAR
jgi:phosphoserine phosphatase